MSKWFVLSTTDLNAQISFFGGGGVFKFSEVTFFYGVVKVYRAAGGRDTVLNLTRLSKAVLLPVRSRQHMGTSLGGLKGLLANRGSQNCPLTGHGQALKPHCLCPVTSELLNFVTLISEWMFPCLYSRIYGLR